MEGIYGTVNIVNNKFVDFVGSQYNKSFNKGERIVFISRRVEIYWL